MRWSLLLFLVACGSDEPVARIGASEVQYGTEAGLFDPAVARDAAGTTVIAWTEGDFAQGDPAWLAIGDLAVQRAVFDPPEVGQVLRRWGPLSPVAGGFVRYEARLAAGGTWLLSELQMDASGAFVDFRQRPSATSRLLTKLEALAVGDRTVVFGVDANLQIVAEVRTPGRDDGTTTIVVDSLAPARWALEAAPGGPGAAVVAWMGFSDEPTRDDVRQYLAWIDGLDGAPSVTVVRSGTTVTGELVDLAATEEGVGTLWLTPEGRLRLYVTAERAEMDLGAPAFDAGDELVQSPALFACAERLIVTWRRAADTAGNGTRAVLVDPATGAASTSFAWPLATADGPAAYGPLDHGVDYAQVGPCQGKGCAQNWLSTGTIELSF